MNIDRCHIVICGTPRSGTTLLHLMIRETVTNFAVPRKELPMKNVKYAFDRIITKHPADVCIIHSEKCKDPDALQIILMTRDPRSIVCSTHGKSEGQYKMDWDVRLITGNDGPRRWEEPGLGRFLQAIDNVQSKWGSCLIKYEDFVQNPDKIQNQINQQFPVKFNKKFTDAWQDVVNGKSKVASDMPDKLNGVRSIDTSSIESWKQHPERVLDVVDRHPEIVDWVRYLGYEKDDKWVDKLRKSV